MNINDVLLDGFGRIGDVVHKAVSGLTEAQLETRVDDDANSVAWLIWHLTRVQDSHLADVANTEEVWTAKRWFDKFNLAVDKAATGYGDSRDDVAAIRGVSGKTLLGYFDDVSKATTDFITSLSAKDFDRIVDKNWDPPVTLGTRLVSVIADDLQHAGQAAFARGVIERSQ